MLTGKAPDGNVFSTMDPAQIALLIVIIGLTILLVVLGVQSFFILKELRKTLEKANKVLDNTEEITESVSGPVSSLSAIMMGLKTGASLASIFGGKKKGSNG